MHKSTSFTQHTIAIIGGGAAGLMAAYFAKLNNTETRVLLIEKNKYLGAKVIISGGGRCNVTTGISTVSEVLRNYPRGSDFLRTAMNAFPPTSVQNWFETQGVPLKTEADFRVFPVSDDGHDIVGALENALQELQVEIRCDTAVAEISHVVDRDAESTKESPKFLIKLKSSEEIPVHKLILTTGGNAYRQTGSTGDGYAFAQALGHTIAPLAPSLSSFITAEKWPTELSGISFQQAKSSFISATDQKFERSGPFLFTHKGLTGPAIFALSAMAAYENFSTENPARILIDFFPDMNSEKLEEDIIDKFEKNSSKKLLTVLGFIVPHRLAEKILSETTASLRLKIPANLINCSEVSRQLRQHIIRQLKSLELHLIGRGAGEEFVTAGGVPLSEVDPQTMQSRITTGLYFAGELLDIDGFTGGFNLQASWATGALAGEKCH